jgi:hypothetical protein
VSVDVQITKPNMTPVWFGINTSSRYSPPLTACLPRGQEAETMFVFSQQVKGTKLFMEGLGEHER